MMVSWFLFCFCYPILKAVLKATDIHPSYPTFVVILDKYFHIFPSKHQICREKQPTMLVSWFDSSIPLLDAHSLQDSENTCIFQVPLKILSYWQGYNQDKIYLCPMYQNKSACKIIQWVSNPFNLQLTNPILIKRIYNNSNKQRQGKSRLPVT